MMETVSDSGRSTRNARMRRPIVLSINHRRPLANLAKNGAARGASSASFALAVRRRFTPRAGLQSARSMEWGSNQ
jgi:hypothetical protein